MVFMTRMEDTRLPKCVMFGELVGGTGCGEGQEKEWMGYFLDDLRAFGINGDQWTTGAQNEGEWRRTAQQGAEQFMAKWITAEKTRAGLRHAVVCPNVTGRTKERIAQSKRARAGSLTLVDKPQVARTFILRAFVWFADVITFLWCYLCFVLLRFRLYGFIEAAALRSIALRYTDTRIATRESFFPFFCIFGDVAFPSIFYTIAAFSLYGEYAARFSLPGGVFLPCDHGL